MLDCLAALIPDEPQSPMRFAPPECAADARLQAFLALWEARRGERPMPERGDIRPRDMKDYLPDIHLYELIDEGRDFRIRLVGTRFSEAAGYDATGELLSRVSVAPLRERMFACASHVVESVAPVYGMAEPPARPNVHAYGIEALMTPLATAGAFTHILGLVAVTVRDPALA